MFKKFLIALALCATIASTASAQLPRVTFRAFVPQKSRTAILGSFTRVLTVDATVGDYATTALAYTYIGTQTHDSTHQWVVLVSPDIAETGSRPTYTYVVWRANTPSTATPCSDGQGLTYVAASKSWSCGAIAGASVTGASPVVNATSGPVAITSDLGAINNTAATDIANVAAGSISETAGTTFTVTAPSGNCFLGTNGAKVCETYASEAITLSTSGATTDSSANLLPANAEILSVACRVTTSITTATDWSVGDGTTAARFCSANSTMTSGTSAVCLNHKKGGVSTDTAGPTQASAAKLRITTTGTPGAGAIRCEVFARVTTAPTS